MKSAPRVYRDHLFVYLEWPKGEGQSHTLVQKFDLTHSGFGKLLKLLPNIAPPPGTHRSFDRVIAARAPKIARIGARRRKILDQPEGVGEAALEIIRKSR